MLREQLEASDANSKGNEKLSEDVSLLTEKLAEQERNAHAARTGLHAMQRNIKTLQLKMTQARSAQERLLADTEQVKCAALRIRTQLEERRSRGAGGGAGTPGLPMRPSPPDRPQSSLPRRTNPPQVLSTSASTSYLSPTRPVPGDVGLEARVPNPVTPGSRLPPPPASAPKHMSTPAVAKLRMGQHVQAPFTAPGGGGGTVSYTPGSGLGQSASVSSLAILDGSGNPQVFASPSANGSYVTMTPKDFQRGTGTVLMTPQDGGGDQQAMSFDTFSQEEDNVCKSVSLNPPAPGFGNGGASSLLMTPVRSTSKSIRKLNSAAGGGRIGLLR